MRLTKEVLGWPVEPAFHVPEQVLAEFRVALEQGAARQADWQERFDAYERAFPEEAAEWRRGVAGHLPEGWEAHLPAFAPEDAASMATRAASGKVLNALAPVIPNLAGGSGDLAPSNNTYLSGYADFARDNWEGRNLRFGVREHAMGGIVNGLAVHGGIIPYGGTFLAFSDWMRGAIRLGAIMGCHSIYVFTHDSIGLGEDGPTHQPIEQLMALRAIPNLTVLRPADANETAAAWKIALERRNGPTSSPSPARACLSSPSRSAFARAFPVAPTSSTTHRAVRPTSSLSPPAPRSRSPAKPPGRWPGRASPRAS